MMYKINPARFNHTYIFLGELLLYIHKKWIEKTGNK